MRKRCDLYLRLSAGALSSADWPGLEALLREARPAALLLSDGHTNIPLDRLRDAGMSGERQTIAILIENDPRLALALKADGVHLRGGSAQVAEARSLLGEEAVIGVSSPLTRHEAMVIAEAGADYIAFGEPALSGQRDIGALADMISWWDELFEVPCVAWLSDSDTVEDAYELVRAGADFLCAGIQRNDFEERSAMIRDLAAMTGDLAKTA